MSRQSRRKRDPLPSAIPLKRHEDSRTAPLSSGRLQAEEVVVRLPAAPATAGSARQQTWLLFRILLRLAAASQG